MLQGCPPSTQGRSMAGSTTAVTPERCGTKLRGASHVASSRSSCKSCRPWHDLRGVGSVGQCNRRTPPWHSRKRQHPSWCHMPLVKAASKMVRRAAIGGVSRKMEAMGLAQLRNCGCDFRSVAWPCQTGVEDPHRRLPPLGANTHAVPRKAHHG
jgi:hypothetical protein